MGDLGHASTSPLCRTRACEMEGGGSERRAGSEKIGEEIGKMEEKKVGGGGEQERVQSEEEVGSAPVWRPDVGRESFRGESR